MYVCPVSWFLLNKIKSNQIKPIGPKNTNLVEDVKIFLPVKTPFGCFRGEVENVSANQRPGWPSCFSDRPKKHKLGRWRWDLVSCKVSSNSVQRFQRRTRKCEKLTTTFLRWRKAFGSGALKRRKKQVENIIFLLKMYPSIIRNIATNVVHLH